MNGPEEYRHSKRSRTKDRGLVYENVNFSVENIPPVGEMRSVRGFGRVELEFVLLGELGNDIVRNVEGESTPHGHMVISDFIEEFWNST